MNYTIADRILRSEFFRNYQTAFAAGIGLPLDFVPANETHRLPYAGQMNESAFCRLLREGGGQSWETANAIVETEAQVDGGTITITTAIGGMLESAIPIRNGTVTIGYLRLGQARQSRPTEAGFKQAVAGLCAKRGIYDMTRLKEAYFEVTVMPLDRYTGIVELVDLFARQLEEHINRLVLMRQKDEPASIAKAKRFIIENLTEDLSLGQVASQSGVSTFHLCKCFKKATGTTLTEFVGRLRVEKAKELLLNSLQSVSEIALDVGFNSLSQFNRLFSRYVGKTPTKFRYGGKDVEEEVAAGMPDRTPAQITLLSVAS